MCVAGGGKGPVFYWKTFSALYHFPFPSPSIPLPSLHPSICTVISFILFQGGGCKGALTPPPPPVLWQGPPPPPCNWQWPPPPWFFQQKEGGGKKGKEAENWGKEGVEIVNDLPRFSEFFNLSRKNSRSYRSHTHPTNASKIKNLTFFLRITFSFLYSNPATTPLFIFFSPPILSMRPSKLYLLLYRIEIFRGCPD